MSKRYDVYCINCGTEVKRVRIGSDKEDAVKIECPTCNFSSIVYTNDDEELNQAKVEISADKKTIWKNVDSNLEPIFTCPLCGHLGLGVSKADSSDFLNCSGTGCKRLIEVVYT